MRQRQGETETGRDIERHRERAIERENVRERGGRIEIERKGDIFS